MKCGGCVKTVEKALLSHESVFNANVNLVERTALIDIQEKENSLEDILITLANRGFPAKERVASQTIDSLKAQESLTQQWWAQWKQLIIALSLLVLSVVGHLAEGGAVEIPILGSLP